MISRGQIAKLFYFQPGRNGEIDSGNLPKSGYFIIDRYFHWLAVEIVILAGRHFRLAIIEGLVGDTIIENMIAFVGIIKIVIFIIVMMVVVIIK